MTTLTTNILTTDTLTTDTLNTDTLTTNTLTIDTLTTDTLTTDTLNTDTLTTDTRNNDKEIIISDISQLNSNICIAIKTNKEKCNQHIKEGEIFCNRHYNLNEKKSNILDVRKLLNDNNYKLVLKNGIYTFQTNEKKKRGRRRKYEIAPEFYDDNYITVWPEIVSGKRLLIDNDNNVYSFNFKLPEYLGKKTIDAKLLKA